MGRARSAATRARATRFVNDGSINRAAPRAQDKRYSRDSTNQRGRVRVALRNEEDVPIRPEITSRAPRPRRSLRGCAARRDTASQR